MRRHKFSSPKILQEMTFKGYRLEVHRILKIRTPYSRILSSILKGLPHLVIEYFRVPESLVKLNDLVGIEYLEVTKSLVVPNDLV